MTSSMRDPQTGELLYKASILMRVDGEILPRLYNVADWEGVRRFLGSAEFKDIAGRVDYLTITPRED